MKRKVRKDFDLSKEYSVNVEGCTEEKKKEVQQAFFDVGIKWGRSLAEGEYPHLDALQYTNTSYGGISFQRLLWSNNTQCCNMSPLQFLDLVYEPEQQGHIHAHLMALYAEDAKTHTKPWKLWQVKGDDGVWRYICINPMWAYDTEYRRKPKTHIVHGVEIPFFEFTPEVGEEYYTANVGLPEFFEKGYRGPVGCTFTQRMIERGLIYPYTEEGKKAAILHSKIMLGIV